MKYLLDTNILIYLKDPYSEHYGTVGRNFMQSTLELIETHFQILPLTREQAKLFGELKPVPPDPAFQQEWDLKDKNMIGFVGSFYRYKGLDLLITAFASFPRKWHKGLMIETIETGKEIILTKGDKPVAKISKISETKKKYILAY